MSSPCDQLDRFLDGDLSEAESQAFRLHLAGCPDCPDRLARALQLIALAAETTADDETTPTPPFPGAPLPTFRPRIVPTELGVAPRPPSKPRGERAMQQRRLVVTGIHIPDHLKLQPLDDWGPEVAAGVDATRLHGAEATPDRVLEAMQDADEIVINAHSMAELGTPDASILVLSPDPGAQGRYWLQASDIQGRLLPQSPVVVLGACYAADSVPYPHVPLSLPAAFIRAGATTVLASAYQAPGAGQSLFFDAVLRRIRTGQPPVIAVQDERRAWARKPGSAWTNDVLVFE